MFEAKQTGLDVLRAFLIRYLVEQNLEQTLSLLSREIYWYGTGAQEEIRGIAQARRYLQTEYAKGMGRFQIEFLDQTEQQMGPDSWVTRLKCRIDYGVARMDCRISAASCAEEGRQKLVTIHMSVPNTAQKEGEYFSLLPVKQFEQELYKEFWGDQIVGGLLGGYCEPHFPFFMANQKLLQFLGYEDEESFAEDIGHCIENIVYPADRDMLKTTVAQQLAHGRVFSAEYRIRHRSGLYIWVENRGKMMQLENGRTAAVSVLKDISKEKYEGWHDVLTGFYNREGFFHTAGDILQSSAAGQYLILFFNIKGFKAINELFGTEGGDQVLVRSAKLLQSSALQPLVSARLEADHFVSLIRKENFDPDTLMRLCRRVFTYNDQTFRFYARCGVYEVTDVSIPVSSMCDRAKLAKEYITDDFLKPYAIYEKSMSDGMLTQKELTSELARALHAQEFKVYYQPIVEAQSGRVVFAEALVRWQHPTKGLLTPGKFIPTFEQNGYVTQLDRYMGEQVVAFLKKRLEENKKVVPVAINLSQMDFYTDDLETKVMNTSFAKTAVAPLFRLEITESAYCALMEKGTELADWLRGAGIQLIMDDFGAGYSSFSSLQKFDFDIIKLDMGFVQNIGKNRKTEWIIHSILDMAHHLGSMVVAEGVETQEQADFLRREGCDYLQGFYFSRPLDEAHFVALLERGEMEYKI